ncbi:MAG TPA: hypothetical protein DCG75_13515 [Bacteroidales bacterium]|nr:hypothetical protein [Bacteroidales bacterium]
MRNTKFLKLSLALIVPLFFFSCEKPVDPPQANFSAFEYYSTDTEIDISFTDQSSNSPDQWFWTFEGGIPSTSTDQNPIVTYTSSGTFDVTLWVKNSGGENETSYYNYINVVQFNNPLFTDIDVTVDYETKTMSPDEYVRFVKIDDTSVDYTAETSGKTTGGTVVGEELSWDNTVDLTSYSSYNLITYDFIFFYVTNSSGYSLSPFFVNFNAYDETVDNIIIPSDGVQYRTGYYYANYGMEVRAYYQYDSYYFAQWYINTDNSSNQWRNLTYYGKSETGKSENALDLNIGDPEMIYPGIESGSKKVFDSNAKDLVNSNTK